MFWVKSSSSDWICLKRRRLMTIALPSIGGRMQRYSRSHHAGAAIDGSVRLCSERARTIVRFPQKRDPLYANRHVGYRADGNSFARHSP
jgi:hypothetical protein